MKRWRKTLADILANNYNRSLSSETLEADDPARLLSQALGLAWQTGRNSAHEDTAAALQSLIEHRALQVKRGPNTLATVVRMLDVVANTSRATAFEEAKRTVIATLVGRGAPSPLNDITGQSLTDTLTLGLDWWQEATCAQRPLTDSVSPEMLHQIAVDRGLAGYPGVTAMPIRARIIWMLNAAEARATERIHRRVDAAVNTARDVATALTSANGSAQDLIDELQAARP